MTQAFSSTAKEKKFGLRAAIGSPISLWLPVSSHWLQLSWVLTGKFALMGANAVLMLFLATRLELQTYGLLVITISGQLLISRVLMAGVDMGMVRLTAIPELQERSRQVVTAGLVLIGGTSIAAILILLVSTPVLSVFAIPGWALWSMLTGAIGTSLVDYGYGYRLARHEYPKASLAQGGTAIWRLGLTSLAVVLLPAYSLALFAAYHGASLLSGLVQTFLIVRRNWDRPDRALIKRLLSYSFWQGKANLVVIFSLYQGIFLLMVLDRPAATGIFGLGLTLSLGFFALYNAYSEYLSVRIRSLKQVKTVSRFVARAQQTSLILILACVPVVFAVALLIPRFLEPEWHEVVPIFVYLAAATILLILEAPLVAVCHYLLKPQLITLGWVMHAVLIGIAGLILFPLLGAVGVALAQVIGSVVASIVLASLVIRSLRSAIERNPVT